MCIIYVILAISDLYVAVGRLHILDFSHLSYYHYHNYCHIVFLTSSFACTVYTFSSSHPFISSINFSLSYCFFLIMLSLLSFTIFLLFYVDSLAYHLLKIIILTIFKPSKNENLNVLFFLACCLRIILD